MTVQGMRIISPGKSAGLSPQPIASPSLVAGRPVIGTPAQFKGFKTDGSWYCGERLRGTTDSIQPCQLSSNLKELTNG